MLARRKLFRRLKILVKNWPDALHARVTRFFLVQHTKTGKNIPNNHKLFQIDTKYTKWPQKKPNGHKIYQHLPFQDPPKFKFIQIGIFGLKICHLATLLHAYLQASSLSRSQKQKIVSIHFLSHFRAGWPDEFVEKSPKM
jgi:hypothetical protein